MGLKYKWDVKNSKPCCGNCIHMFEKRDYESYTVNIYGDNVIKKVTRFYCKVGTKIPDNH